ncbi:MAG: zinc-dependent alcohol dehydrogenase family protein [Proteobacteria bacterium]|nr:zinc-dependent alcohol dehydrogenase family protein [Pseudomonadota bacterium]MBU1419344.1 zinc-dependent alcohol dehydrogenase family protein [Pseudomonadota bacterium]MBU1453907.1 zinc-dependent alcohol dehydrogenase family protein [Pseudomonadota bacterium]
MKAMVLHQLADLSQNRAPLTLEELPIPLPGPDELLIKVRACGVCHTELDEIEGRTPPLHFPMILGHQAVGIVVGKGKAVPRTQTGNRVGVAWIASACGCCHHCLAGNDNLCPDFRATGRDVNGGYAQYLTAREDFVHPIPERFSDSQAAPLLCAGAIGYRSLKLTGLKNGDRLGLTGFGSSAHLVLKMVRHRYPDSEVFVFARKEAEQNFALELGAAWAGDIGVDAPQKLQSIIDTTPAWKPVVAALHNLEAGGRLVINAIRKQERDKEELLHLNYETHLWMEKEIKSVANVASSDVREFLALAAEIPLLPEVEEYPLPEANRALLEIKEQRIRGAKVLILPD